MRLLWQFTLTADEETLVPDLCSLERSASPAGFMLQLSGVDIDGADGRGRFTGDGSEEAEACFLAYSCVSFEGIRVAELQRSTCP